MNTVHVITGATGFVGSAVVLELLSQSDAPVLGIVRPREDAAPVDRLRSTLHELVDAYAMAPELHAAIDARVDAVAGNLWESDCGVDSLPVESPEFWHCAASLQYQDRHKAQIDETNIRGTGNALDLAEKLDARVFNMVSAAYVCGTRSGLIREERADAANVNNHYEASKIEAETLVHQSRLPARVMRPGIVIGHSKTKHALNYNGLYGFIRGLSKFARALERAQPGLARELEVKLCADPDGGLGLVTVDHVAFEAAALSLAGAPEGIYHLTNPTPPSVGEAINTCFEIAGLRRPQLVPQGTELGSIDRKLQRSVDFYNSYIVREKHFDRSRVHEVLGERALGGLEMPLARLEEFCSWYARVLEQSRETTPVAR